MGCGQDSNARMATFFGGEISQNVYLATGLVFSHIVKRVSCNLSLIRTITPQASQFLLAAY